MLSPHASIPGPFPSHLESHCWLVEGFGSITTSVAAELGGLHWHVYLSKAPETFLYYLLSLSNSEGKKTEHKPLKMCVSGYTWCFVVTANVTITCSICTFTWCNFICRSCLWNSAVAGFLSLRSQSEKRKGWRYPVPHQLASPCPVIAVPVSAFADALRPSKGQVRPAQVDERQKGFVKGGQKDWTCMLVLESEHRRFYLVASAKQSRTCSRVSGTWIWEFLIQTSSHIFLRNFEQRIYLCPLRFL